MPQDQSLSWGELLRRLGMAANVIIAELFALYSELPHRTKQASVVLAKRGWFLDLGASLGEVAGIVQAVHERTEEEVEEILLEWMRGRVDEIEQDLIDQFPGRKDVFRDAFEAHREGRYTLSIPVLLIQADGIFSEDPSTTLFEARRREEGLAELMAREDPDDFFAATLEPIGQVLPLWANRGDRQGALDQGDPLEGLNRHQVLHGESTDYATERYSLQVIALLSYVSNVWRNRDSTGTA